MCTIGVIDGRIVFKNYDWEEKSIIKIKQFPDRIEAFCPVICRPIALYTKNAVAVVTTLIRNHKATAPLEWIRDKLAEINTANDFISLLKTGPDFTGFNMIVADKKDAYVLEIWGKQISVTKIKTAVRTNHFFILESGPQKFEDYPSSFIRYDRANKLIKTASEDLESVKSILKDHENGPSENSICRHGKINTQSGIIFDLENHKLFYTKGNPCTNKFIEVKC